MRNAVTVAFATSVLVVSVAAAPLASADPVEDPALPVECATLAVLVDPACLLVEQVDDVLAPVTDVPDGAPTPDVSDPADAPEPAPAPSSDTRASSAAAPTAADLGSAPAQPAVSASSPRVFDVPMGSTLLLGSLGLPSLGLVGTPATGNRFAAGAEDLALPAARAAASLPHASKTTAVAMALTMLLLAGGLLIDQVRKARIPIQL